MKHGFVALAAGVCMVALAAPAQAQEKSFTIPAGSLKSALDAYARQTARPVIYKSNEVRASQSSGFNGVASPEQALEAILANTGFVAVATNSGAVAVVRSRVGAAEELRLIDVNDQDIIVTASKREQSQRSLAASISPLTGKQLDQIGAQGFKDYLNGLPGVQFQQSTPGVSNVTMRGVGVATIYPDQGQATTGIYVNDVPLTDPSFAVSVPDLDVFDVQRVEVMRGPQGTMFGAATLGGAVNYIYNPVSLSEVQARGQASLHAVEHGGDLGYTAKAALNLPIVNDVLGVRIAAAHRSDAGYLDNVGTDTRDSNTRRVNAVRGNLLWKISDGFDLTYFGLYDRSRSGDGFYSFPTTVGELKRNTVFNETATFTTEVHSLKFNGDLGFATLTISGARLNKKQDSLADYTPYYGDPTYSIAKARSKSDIGEVRLTSASGKPFEWLVGAYYGKTDENYPVTDFQGTAEVYNFLVRYQSKEKSAFGEATLHISDALRLTAGGRYYDISLDTATLSNSGNQNESGFSPKASITFEPSKEFMAYALFSKGFRMGGVNLSAPLAGFPTPLTYGSDGVINYETGVRFTLLDRTLFIDSTAFYIDWTDIQLRLTRPDRRSYVANAGSARSYGFENSISWKPSSSFDLRANLTYLNAEINKTLALGNGTTLVKGTKLPGASHWNTSASATYHFGLPNEPYVSIEHRYISRATNDFDPSLVVGGYNTLALRAGAKFGNFTLQAYVTNLTDKRGATTASYLGADPITFYNQPRTFGLSVDWTM